MELKSAVLLNFFCLLILQSTKAVFPFSIKLVFQQLYGPTTDLRSSWLNQNNELLKNNSLILFLNKHRTPSLYYHNPVKNQRCSSSPYLSTSKWVGLAQKSSEVPSTQLKPKSHTKPKESTNFLRYVSKYSKSAEFSTSWNLRASPSDLGTAYTCFPIC